VHIFPAGHGDHIGTHDSKRSFIMHIAIEIV